jgi:hypothetical protein
MSHEPRAQVGARPLTLERLAEMGETDLRAALLHTFLRREGLQSLEGLSEPDRAAWLRLLKPRPRNNSTALLTVRTQIVGGLSPAHLAKRAALLYDRLVVQVGRLHGAMPPFETVDTGAEVWDPLKALDVDWISELELPAFGLERLGNYSSHRFFFGRAAGELAREALREETPLGNAVSAFRRVEGRDVLDFDLAIKLRHVANDLQIAEWLGVSLVAPTELLKDMQEVKIPRGDAISLFVPDLDSLTWENIHAFREHPASQDARAKLAEWERESTAQGVADDTTRQAQVASAVVLDLLTAIEELRPRLGEAIGKEAILVATSFFPVVGPGVATVAALGDAARASSTFHHSWPAALAILRAQATESTRD